MILRCSILVYNSRDLSKHLQSVRVHDGESSEGGALGKFFNEKRGSRFELNLGILELGELRGVVDLDTSSLLSHLPKNLGHLARNLGGSGEDDRTVSRLEHTRMLLDSNQGSEGLDGLEFSVLLVVDDVTSADLLVLGNTLDGKTNRVSGSGGVENLLVLFDREDLLSLQVGRNESNLVTRSKSSLFDGSANNLTNSLNVVDIGHRKTESSIGKTLGRGDEVIKGINNGHTGDNLLGGSVGGPSLVPRALSGVDRLDQVVSVESRVRDERNLLGLVTDHLKHLNEFLLDFVETILRPAARVHLVDSNKNLFNSQKVEKTSVLTGLTFINSQLGIGLGNGGFETSLLGGNQKHTNISGCGSGDHVLDVILVSRGIDDGVVVVGGEEFLCVTLDSNTTVTFFLARIKVVRETEGRLTLLGGEFVELGHLTLGDSSLLENQVTASSRLTGIDVSADNQRQMFLFTHFESLISSPNELNLCFVLSIKQDYDRQGRCKKKEKKQLFSQMQAEKVERKFSGSGACTFTLFLYYSYVVVTLHHRR
mmetsp:Transcript_17302/g.39801  ORF Transcript_17302/g.39801 Transcript_17302/m.39801 type:complete len:538 (-) Transcript_17302:171-1784(-)